jgi:acetoin utilization deacetylase AcuC-like enzyme
MLTIYSDDHHLHHGNAELIDGTLKPCFEMPSRADMVLQRVRQTGLGDIIAPTEHGLEPLLRVHDAAMCVFWSRPGACGRPRAATTTRYRWYGRCAACVPTAFRRISTA